MSGHDYGALLPEGILVGGAVAVLLLGSFLPRRRLPWTRGLASAALLGSVAVASVAGSGAVFEHSYALDPATTIARVVAPLASLAVVWLGSGELARSTREAETYSLVLLGTAGAVAMAGATDLAVLAAAYLLAAVPVYALVGLAQTPTAAEVALKTYLLGALLGVTMLLGTVVLVGVGGATGYADLRAGLLAAPPAGVAVGLVALLAGLVFKAGAVPGHFWVPDAAQGAGVTAAAFVTTVPKVGAVLAIVRVVDLLEGVPVAAAWAVAVVAAVSMTVGNLAALGQDDARRLLGWSAVAQVGFLLMAPAAIADPGAVAAVGLYLAGYAATNLTAFAVAAAHPDRRGMDDWAGLARRHPVSSAALVIAMLGLAGTPPTAVFAGKLTVFSAAWGAGFAWLVVLAAVLSVVSLAYYLRWIRAAFAPERGAAESAPGTRRTTAAVAVVSAAVVLMLGLAAGPVLEALAGPLVL